jgi:ABC-2 type transport system ATP-binding protein
VTQSVTRSVTLELDRVGIGSEPGAALPVVSAVAGPGAPGVVAVETEQAPVLASLVAGGRMRPETGRVLLDGHEDAAAVRAAFALVDTPGVAEPFPVMTVRRVVREELAFAGRRPTRDAVDTVLDALGSAPYADTPVQRVPTDVRVRLLVELALLREGVTGLVITSPERHGGVVADWFAVVRDVAARGVTVLLVTSKAAAETVTELLAATRTPVADAASADVAPSATGATDATDGAEAGPLPDRTVPTGGEPSLQTGSPTGNDADATVPQEARS